MKAPIAYALFGLPFHAVDTDEAEEIIRESIRTRQRCFLSTPNLNFLVTAQFDCEFRRSVLESDLSVADGMPLIWLARILGIPLPERVAGSTLFDRLRRDTGHEPIRVFFFGGLPGVAELAAQRINADTTGMFAVGFLDPGIGNIESMSTLGIIRHINSCNPDLVVVALGAKKGQAWIQKNRDQLTAPVLSHLGAVINFTAGTIRRAPVWMQRSGLEWLWRVKEEYKLLPRYLGDGMWLLQTWIRVVLPLAVCTTRVDRVRTATIDNQIYKKELRIGGNWSFEDLETLSDATAVYMQQPPNTLKLLDLSQLTSLDSSIVACLLRLTATSSGELTQVIPPAKASAAYRQLAANQFFKADGRN